MGEQIEPYWFFHLLRAPNDYAGNLITGREAQFLSYFYSTSDSHVVPAFGREVVDVYTRAYCRPGRMVASYGLYRSIEQDMRDNAGFSEHKLVIPVLAIGAEKGAGAQIAQVTGPVAINVIPMVFKGTGHFIPVERPEALSETIEAFLQGKEIPASWSPERWRPR
jgi:pimeloyl-ACP methyl ester carboxylesterase